MPINKEVVPVEFCQAVKYVNLWHAAIVICFDVLGFLLTYRLCGFEPFFDERGDQAMFQRILRCDYEFISPWWDEVSENAKVGLV